jgi:hypothetical protein
MDNENDTNETPAAPVYDLVQSTYDFRLRDKEGEIRTYTMRELTGEEREAYLNGIRDKFEVMPNGKSRVRNFTGLQSGLLAKCVYDDNGALVPLKLINKWPAKLQSDLYKRANKMSGMDETAEDDAKND